MYINEITAEKILAVGSDYTTLTTSSNANIPAGYSVVYIEAMAPDLFLTLPSTAGYREGQRLWLIVTLGSYPVTINDLDSNLPHPMYLNRNGSVSFILLSPPPMHNQPTWFSSTSINTEFHWRMTASGEGKTKAGNYLYINFAGGSDVFPYFMPHNATIHTITFNASAATTCSLTISNETATIGTQPLTGTSGRYVMEWDVSIGDNLKVLVENNNIEDCIAEIYFRQR